MSPCFFELFFNYYKVLMKVLGFGFTFLWFKSLVLVVYVDFVVAAPIVPLPSVPHHNISYFCIKCVR